MLLGTCLAASFFATSVTRAETQMLDQVVAVVEDDIIMASELRDRLDSVTENLEARGVELQDLVEAGGGPRRDGDAAPVEERQVGVHAAELWRARALLGAAQGPWHVGGGGGLPLCAPRDLEKLISSKISWYFFEFIFVIFFQKIMAFLRKNLRKNRLGPSYT